MRSINQNYHSCFFSTEFAKFDVYKPKNKISVMKTMKTLLATLVILAFSTSNQATAGNEPLFNLFEVVQTTLVQFKVINDTGKEFHYTANGTTKITIPAGQSVGFSYNEGTTLYHWTNNAKGTQWFTIKSVQHGQSYNLSELLKNNLLPKPIEVKGQSK